MGSPPERLGRQSRADDVRVLVERLKRRLSRGGEWLGAMTRHERSAPCVGPLTYSPL